MFITDPGHFFKYLVGQVKIVLSNSQILLLDTIINSLTCSNVSNPPPSFLYHCILPSPYKRNESGNWVWKNSSKFGAHKYMMYFPIKGKEYKFWFLKPKSCTWHQNDYLLPSIYFLLLHMRSNLLTSYILHKYIGIGQAT